MKKKIFKSIGLIFLFILWSLLRKLGQYLLDMKYSHIGGDQFNDNTMAYQLMKAQHHFNGLIHVIYLVGIGLLITWVIMIWVKVKKE